MKRFRNRLGGRVTNNTPSGVSVDGGVSLEAITETLGTDLDSQSFETIGGVVLGRLGRAPEPGDAVEIVG